MNVKRSIASGGPDRGGVTGTETHDDESMSAADRDHLEVQLIDVISAADEASAAALIFRSTNPQPTAGRRDESQLRVRSGVPRRACDRSIRSRPWQRGLLDGFPSTALELLVEMPRQKDCARPQRLRRSRTSAAP